MKKPGTALWVPPRASDSKWSGSGYRTGFASGVSVVTKPMKGNTLIFQAPRPRVPTINSRPSES